MSGGAYEYSNGVNYTAIADAYRRHSVCVVGSGRASRALYDYAWFAGFVVSAAVCIMIMQRAREPSRLSIR